MNDGLSVMPTLAKQLMQEGLGQGLEQGRTEGALIGRTRALAEILGRAVGSFEELAGRDEADWRQLTEELKAAGDPC